MKKILPFLLVALIFSACTKDIEEITQSDPDEISQETTRSLKTASAEVPEFCNDNLEYKLKIVGSDVLVGGVMINNDEDFVYITINAAPENSIIQYARAQIGSVDNLLTFEKWLSTDPILEYPDNSYEINYIVAARSDSKYNLTNPDSDTFTYKLEKPEGDDCFGISLFVKLRSATGQVTYAELIIDGEQNDLYCWQECETPCYDGEETAWAFGTEFKYYPPGSNTTRWGWYSEYVFDIPSFSQTIFAGQDEPIGTLTVTHEAGFLYVTYDLDNAVMGLAHLYVGNDLGEVMNKKGTPRPGKFPYKKSFNQWVNSYTFEIEIATIKNYTEGDVLYIAAHAESYLEVECEE